jgi:predicted amidophosphoribosyltransferase
MGGVSETARDTMNCPRCGIAVDSTDAFCRGCGEALAAGPLVQTPPLSGHVHVTMRTVTKIVCGKCGKQVPLNERACPNCGLAIPSMEEIEAKLLKAGDQSSSLPSSALPSEEMKCPHCGKPLDLQDGLCTGCGQKVELPEIVRETLLSFSSGGVPRARASLGQARFGSSRRVKISLSNLGIVAAGLGALVFFGARQPFSFHAMSPRHISALALWGLALAMIVAGKLSGSD